MLNSINSFVIFLILIFIANLNLTLADEQSDENVAKVSANKKQVTKLQIGIKKRVADCTRKSSKGDVLHIHYRVSCDI